MDRGKHLEMNTRYHDPKAFVARIERAGFQLHEAKQTENSVNTVHVFHATHESSA